MSIQITIERSLHQLNPSMALGIIKSEVTNTDHNSELWNEVQRVTTQIRATLTFEAIKDQPQIAYTRKMYSACGKDPSRYRPSAEALMRRIVKGQDLYRISTLVDLINLVSLKFGYSIGAFDVSRIEGTVAMGIGKSEEIYNGIGKGLLNIENLPVLRDERGAIGSPTSDEERTSIRNDTSKLLMVIYAFGGTEGLTDCMEYTIDLLRKHAEATEIRSRIS